MDNKFIIDEFLLWLNDNIHNNVDLHFDNNGDVKSHHVLSALTDLLGLPRELATTPEEYCSRFVAPCTLIQAQLSYAYVEDGQMMATNGHFGCIVDTDLKNGYYDPFTLQPEDIGVHYPHLRNVIPVEIQLEDQQTFTLSDCKVLTEGLRNKVDLIEIGGRNFNLKYIKMLANGDDQITVRLSHDTSKPSMFYPSSDAAKSAVVFGLSVRVDDAE